MSHEETETFDRVLCWASLIITPTVYILIILPAQAWSPLTEMHMAMSMLEVNRVCDSMLAILADRNLAPREAADKLSAIERVDARQLRQELRVWGKQSTALGFMGLHGITMAMFALFAPRDAAKIRAEPALAQGVRIWLALYSVLFFCPWAFVFLSGAAGPANE